MRWVNRWVGRRLAALAAVAGCSPNAVTLTSGLVSLVALACLVCVPSAVLAGVLAAILLALGFALDSADGQLARLTGAGGPAGEWLDHVVDAARGPLVHLAVAVGMLARGALPPWWALVPLLFSVLGSAQFLSQILAEQLALRSRISGPSGTDRAGPWRSFLLLPVDTGTLYWSFVLWGFPLAFASLYSLLFLVSAAYAVVSMRRKYLALAVPA